MKVESKKIGDNLIQLDVQVPPETVKLKFNEVYEKIGKEAKVPGFRPGKAPRDILEKHHSRLAQDELIRGLIPEAYRQTVEKEKIDAVDLPVISEVKLESNVLFFKAVVEVKPPIELRDYKNLKLKYKKISVAPDEVEKTLQRLKEAHKKEVIDEKFARSLGYKTVELMRESVERQLLLQKESDLRYQLQEDLVKQILSKVSFKMPKSLVERRLEELAQQAKAQLARRGASQEQIASQADKLRKELQPEAESQVKTYLVLEEIARRENIPQDNEHLTQEVIEFLLGEANWIEEA